MSRAEKLIEGYKRQLAEKLGAPVAEIGIYSRPGGLSTALAFAFSDGVGMLGSSEGKKASGGLPMNVIMALTTSELAIFEYKAKGMGGTLKLGDALLRAPRAGLPRRSPGRDPPAHGFGSLAAMAGRSSSMPTSCPAWTSSGTCGLSPHSQLRGFSRLPCRRLLRLRDAVSGRASRSGRAARTVS